MSHPADADYSRFNAPDDDALLAMMDSALAVVEVAQRGRRRVSVEGKGLPVGVQRGWIDKRPDGTEYAVPFPVVVTGDDAAREVSVDAIPTPYREAIFTEAVAAASGRGSHLPPADQVLIASSFEVIVDRVRRMREIACLPGSESDLVLGHALNAIDLGLVGLAKVTGGSDGA